MRGAIAALLGIPLERVSVKASSGNGMTGFGRGEGVFASAVVLVEAPVIVAGFHPVAAALAERPEAVEALLLQEGRRDGRVRELERTAREKGIPVRVVPREELDRTAGKAHNGVAARVATREYDPIEEALGGEPGSRLVLFLDEVTDPGNLGSILRTAAAAGASVVLPERHSAGLNESVSKASAGALERVKVARVGNAARFLEDVKDDRFWVLRCLAGRRAALGRRPDRGRRLLPRGRGPGPPAADARDVRPARGDPDGRRGRFDERRRLGGRPPLRGAPAAPGEEPA